MELHRKSKKENTEAKQLLAPPRNGKGVSSWIRKSAVQVLFFLSPFSLLVSSKSRSDEGRGALIECNTRCYLHPRKGRSAEFPHRVQERVLFPRNSSCTGFSVTGPECTACR